MNQQWSGQRDISELVDEALNLQPHESLFGENNGGVNRPTDVEIESIAVAEAIALRRQDLESSDYGRLLALHYSLLQNARMTFLEFVKTRFIPEHVASKSLPGRRHYQAILKHILRPSVVDALFGVNGTRPSKRLTEVADWPYLDEVRLCAITTDHVQNITAAALETGYSVQTVKHIRNVIGTIIKHAIRRRCFIGENPAFHVCLPPMIRRHNGSSQP